MSLRALRDCRCSNASLITGVCSVGVCYIVTVYSGWINGLGMFGTNAGAAAVMIIVGLCFTAMATVSIITLIKVHRIYRSTGASFQKAQQEFAQGVMRNEGVQNFAGQAAAAGARQAMSGGATGSRY